MRNSQEVATAIKTLAKEKNIAVGKMLSECGLSKNALSTMQSGGYLPRTESLAKIADYLDCSVDFLIGRVKQKNIAAVPDQEDSGSQKLVENYYLLNENAQKELMNYLEYMITKPENLRQDEGKRAV